MNTSIGTKYWFLYVVVLLDLCWNALYQYIHIDGNGRFVTLVTICTLIFMSKKLEFRKILLSPPIVLWGGLMTFHLYNVYIQNIDISIFGIPNIAILEIGLMSLVAFLYKNNPNRTLAVLIIGYLFFCITANFFCEIEENSNRLTGFIYTTQLGQLCGIACMFISMYITLTKRSVVYYFLYAIPLFVMFLAGSRNGLFMVAFAFLILFVFYLKNKKFVYLALFVVCLYASWSYLETTALFERIATHETAVMFKTDTPLDFFFGDRAIYYFLGYLNFLDNPIFGIGLLNFADYNHFAYPLHTEPFTHLVEGGIIAFTLYVSFLGYFIKSIKKQWHTKQDSIIIISIMILGLFFIGLTAREYQYVFFFPVYGLALGVIEKNKTTYGNIKKN